MMKLPSTFKEPSIWKFALHTNVGINEIPMPRGAIPLHVGVQNGNPYLWAYVGAKDLLESRFFTTVLTGGSCPETKHVYIGTVLLDHGQFVIHVFEVFPE